jgi:exosortase E/protease (VPEID-CTERM system)
LHSTIVPAPREDFFHAAAGRSLLLIAGILLLEWISFGNLHTGLQLRQMFLPFLCVASIIGYTRFRFDFGRIANQLAYAHFDGWYFGAHVVAILVCAIISHPGLNFSPLALVTLSREWLILAAAGCLPALWFLLCAFFPPGAIRNLLWSTRIAWLCGVAASVVSWWLVKPLWSLWNQSSASLAPVTFQGVSLLLGLFLPHVDSNPRTFRIGGSHFHVSIMRECSGMEGLGLILVVSVAWLWFFRSELRYPRVLLLVPAALITAWLSNIARISTLILIGNAGAKNVAIGGFHSQAGWIAFNCIGLVFCAAVARIPWFRKDPGSMQVHTEEWNVTAAYLMPWLAILGSSLVARAVSGGFEWLYPLRFVAAASALWYFRTEYRNLQWKPGWLSPALGALVFVGWVLLARVDGRADDPAFAAGLTSLPPVARFAWLALRAGAAVITVPIAEELAFRGYAARRLMTIDFDLVDLRHLSWAGMVGSSVLFGVMHGRLWFAGILAGLVYAFAVRRNGRIGDGVVAHATTNALLAVWVLWRGDWGLW